MQLIFRCLASLRRFRRSTLGYAHEQHMIDRWYEAALAAQGQDRSMAIAALGGIVKGYGDTRHRTTSRLMQILDYLERSPDSESCAIASLHMAAMNPDAAFDTSAVLRPGPEPA